jgi:hypothetical protein
MGKLEEQFAEENRDCVIVLEENGNDYKGTVIGHYNGLVMLAMIASDPWPLHRFGVRVSVLSTSATIFTSLHLIPKDQIITLRELHEIRDGRNVSYANWTPSKAQAAVQSAPAAPLHKPLYQPGDVIIDCSVMSTFRVMSFDPIDGYEIESAATGAVFSMLSPSSVENPTNYRLVSKAPQPMAAPKSLAANGLSGGGSLASPVIPIAAPKYHKGDIVDGLGDSLLVHSYDFTTGEYEVESSTTGLRFLVGWLKLEDPNLFKFQRNITTVQVKVAVPQKLEFVKMEFKTSNSSVDLSRYPNTCPKCQSPAYLGFTSRDCSNKACK